MINKVPNLRPGHDKIHAQWASSIMLESMLERVGWYNVLRWNLEIEPFFVR